MIGKADNLPKSSFTTQAKPLIFVPVNEKTLRLDRVTLVEAVIILKSLFQPGGLSAEKFLLYGSIARELLTMEGDTEFNDIDIVVSKVYDSAVQEFAEVMDRLNFNYSTCKDEQGEFFCLAYKEKNIRIELIDREEGKTAFPKEFIEFSQWQFTESESASGINIPCVPKDKLDSWTGEKSLYRNSGKSMQQETRYCQPFDF